MLDLLLETIHYASIVPFANDVRFYAMKYFGYPMAAPFILVVTGALIGHIVNWYIGRTLIFFEHRGHIKINPAHYERARHFADRYGFFLLIFAWVPLCNLLVVASGFLKLPLKKILPIIALGLAAHYGWIAFG